MSNKQVIADKFEVLATTFSPLLFWSFLAAVAGLLIIPTWRSNPHLALGSIPLAILGGAAISTAFGAHLTTLAIFFFAYAGPAFIIMISKPETVQKVIDTYLDKLRNKK